MSEEVDGVHFTSDTHFHHKKMVVHRGFASVDDMHEAMLLAWNARVKPSQKVYHLGDVSFAGKTRTNEVMSQLNGILRVVPGNHDDVGALAKLYTKDGPVEVMERIQNIKLVESRFFRNSVHRFVLSHFPLQVWEGGHYGWMHVHGHSHGFCAPIGKRMDVGVDSSLGFRNGYAPISAFDVIQALKNVAYVQHDHHEESDEGEEYET